MRAYAVGTIVGTEAASGPGSASGIKEDEVRVGGCELGVSAAQRQRTDALPDGELFDARSGGQKRSGDLHPRDERRLGCQVAGAAAHDVRKVHARSADLDQHLARARGGTGPFTNAEHLRIPEALDNNRPHRRSAYPAHDCLGSL